MAFSREELQAHPDFMMALRFLAEELRSVYDGNPRLARFLASHQRWLLSQAAFALYLEYDPAIPQTGLTTARLRDMITGVNAASRNTVLNFLDQLQSYRFIRVADDPNKRPRRFEATEVCENAMFHWVTANLASLDHVDGGSRARVLLARPELFRLVQPRVARRAIDDSHWREPPRRVAMFLWTEAGGLVMDELVRRIIAPITGADRYDLGRVDARAMAQQFMMSRTHLQRLLRKAVDEGCLQWHDERKKTHLWFSRDFLEEYIGWQAVKFALVDEAFDWACREASRDHPETRAPACAEG
ncbi:MAG: hypothetical protein WC048_12370 [Rhizobium sp.]